MQFPLKGLRSEEAGGSISAMRHQAVTAPDQAAQFIGFPAVIEIELRQIGIAAKHLPSRAFDRGQVIGIFRSGQA